MNATSPALVFGYTVVVAAPGAHHGEVDEDPFVARRGRQRDAVLGGDAQRDQPRGEEADAVIDLLPGDALPAVLVRIPERLGVRGGRDAIDEHPGRPTVRASRSWTGRASLRLQAGLSCSKSRKVGDPAMGNAKTTARKKRLCGRPHQSRVIQRRPNKTGRIRDGGTIAGLAWLVRTGGEERHVGRRW